MPRAATGMEGRLPLNPRRFFAARGLRPRKRLGQNFLIDMKTARRIARSVGAGPGDTVVEVGAGLGALTKGLAERGTRVAAVEKDPLLAHALAEAAAAEGAAVEVVEGDFLRLDLETLAGGRRVLVAGNLPYGAASQIVLKLLDDRALLRSATLMVQREVAERLAAPPGGKTYGAISAVVQAFMSVRKLFIVGPAVFWPRPEVDSAVIRLEPRPEPCVADEDEPLYRRVVRAAFGGRRKKVSNALGREFGRRAAEAALAEAGLPAGARAEELGPEAYAALTRAIKEAAASD